MMEVSIQEREPKLDKPGAGLPLHEWLVAKFILFPRLFRTTTVEQAVEQFEAESNRILSLARSVDKRALTERRLIRRLRGLEDSSRYWSIAMAMQHLVIVGDGTRGVILSLSKGNTNLPRRGTADVKPVPDVDAERVLADFEELTAKFVRTACSVNFEENADAKHPHPWFGPLNARQWLLFAPRHHEIHRRQIEEIIKLL